MTQFDWNDRRYFLAVVREGNPIRAAKVFKVEHTTVRRRFAALEAALDTELFDARENHHVLTLSGESLLPAAETIESAALAAEGDIADTDLANSGTVRSGAPDGFGIHHLASRIGRLRARYPALDVQLMVMSTVFNHSKREADIAVIPAPPAQGRQITRKLTDCGLGLFATEAYLGAAPPIRSLQDLQNHRLAAYAADLMFTPNINFLRQVDRTLHSKIESNDIAVQFRIAASGAALCVIPTSWPPASRG